MDKPQILKKRKRKNNTKIINQQENKIKSHKTFKGRETSSNIKTNKKNQLIQRTWKKNEMKC